MGTATPVLAWGWHGLTLMILSIKSKSTKMTKWLSNGQVLEMMQSEDEREIENRLVILLDYEKFDFIKVLLANRFAVVYCTLLGQAQVRLSY
jgi:hypothetical protein